MEYNEFLLRAKYSEDEKNIWSSYKISYGVKSVVNNNTFQNDLT